MSELRISASRMATTSAAFVATMSGYLNVDAVIASEQARAAKVAATTSGVVVKLHRTVSELNSSNPLLSSSFVQADRLHGTTTRNVTRIEDLILRKATMRAGRLIAKGRLVSK